MKNVILKLQFIPRGDGGEERMFVFVFVSCFFVCL